MSTIKVDNLQTTAGVGLYPAKAWVNFNGSGTVAIRGSGNVSSITDHGTGQYTPNFSTAMPSSNYSFAINAAWNGTTSNQMHAGRRSNSPISTTGFRIETSNNLGSVFTLIDSPEVLATTFH